MYDKSSYLLCNNALIQRLLLKIKSDYDEIEPWSVLGMVLFNCNSSTLDAEEVGPC